jgi:hypothetical protein
VVRAYNQNGKLNIVTGEQSTCVYDTTSCSYDITKGIAMTSSDKINHLTEWNTDNTLYVKCKDLFNNKPSFDECSITVRPFSGY